MEMNEWSKLWYNSQLDLESYQAVCIKRGFPSHMHDYYVVCLIEQGLQSFSHRKVKHLTPPGGLIILNPGDDHTGEPADEYGFEFKALYPTMNHMQDIIEEISGKPQPMPFFPKVRIDDAELSGYVRTLHLALTSDTSPLERESLFLMVISRLILRHAEIHTLTMVPKKERQAIKQATSYIQDHVSDGVTLTELAEYVGLSRYYFLRVFREETGMPPYVFLESIRINKAKQLLESGWPLTKVAIEMGFSDQSHFTNSFKRLIGVTPGQYVQIFNK